MTPRTIRRPDDGHLVVETVSVVASSLDDALARVERENLPLLCDAHIIGARQAVYWPGWWDVDVAYNDEGYEIE